MTDQDNLRDRLTQVVDVALYMWTNDLETTGTDGEFVAQAIIDDLDGFIAKVKADALREWSGVVQMELAASASHGIDLGEDFLHGAHSMLRQAGEFANRIEEEE